MHLSMPGPVKDLIATVSGLLDDSKLVLVGGSVRDILLGVEPKDYDFATPLLPDEVERRLRAAGKRVYTVGRRYGTIGFKHDGHFIEVTTFRSDLYDMQTRKPVVTFTDDLQADLARRDFTINAMAVHVDGKLTDPFNGAADIAAKVLRAVGEPGHRFLEDPLRMLRLARFTARYGFDVDESTEAAVVKRAHTLAKVSRERVSAEMDGLLIAANVSQGLELLARTGLLSYAVPLLAVQPGYDQNSRYHEFDLWTHSCKTVEAVDAEVELRWAALLHDVGKPFVRRDKPGRSTYVHHDLVGANLVKMVGQDLRWSNDRLDRIQSLVRDHLDDDSPLRAADNGAKKA